MACKFTQNKKLTLNDFQVYSAEEQRALALYKFEEKANHETQLVPSAAAQSVLTNACRRLKKYNCIPPAKVGVGGVRALLLN